MEKRTSLPLRCRMSLTAIFVVFPPQAVQLSVLGPSSKKTDIRYLTLKSANGHDKIII